MKHYKYISQLHVPSHILVFNNVSSVNFKIGMA